MKPKSEVLFIAKTNLNVDGRILNQMRILQDGYENRLSIHFLLLPDKPYTLDLGKNIKVDSIKLGIRNSKFLRPLTVIEFTVKALLRLIRLKPTTIHVQDTAVVLPAYFYRILMGKKINIIYDDHEMPNENHTFQEGMFYFFENKIMKLADRIIFANKERMEVLTNRLNLDVKKTSYFLNLPYYDDEVFPADISKDLEATITNIDELRSAGVKIFMHQGSLQVERGRRKLADFSRLLNDHTKILIVGVPKEQFTKFVSEYDLDISKFIFAGFVNYHLLDKLWGKVDASIVMYLPTYINNKLCAPNRFYISLKYNMPILVNKDNPVLNNFINIYNCGAFIEDLGHEEIGKFFEKRYKNDTLSNLISQQKESFLTNYRQLV